MNLSVNPAESNFLIGKLMPDKFSDQISYYCAKRHFRSYVTEIDRVLLSGVQNRLFDHVNID